MDKRDDSVRSLGTASIGTDKPTRDKLKKAAARAGVHLSEYMRYLADSVDSQGKLVHSLPVGDIKLKSNLNVSTLMKLATRINSILTYGMGKPPAENDQIIFDILDGKRPLADVKQLKLNIPETNMKVLTNEG